MGKPYTTEIDCLSDVYASSMAIDVSELAAALGSVCNTGLVAVGSGGSLTAAHFQAALHERFCNQISRAATPMELYASANAVRNAAVACITASGKNKDILNAFNFACANEAMSLITLCATLNSPIVGKARETCIATPFEFALPTGKDGFLATNSLLAFCVLLARGYSEAFGPNCSLPNSLSKLLKSTGSQLFTSKSFLKQSSAVLERPTIQVIYSVTTKIAAIDLESKFSEAALGAVLLSDWRNFAHGRHHWLSKHRDTTSVIALASEEDKALAERTLSLLPSSTPTALLSFSGNFEQQAISSLVSVLHIVGEAGRQRGIDPGRPGVAAFGRRLYHLGHGSKNNATDNLENILARKFGPLVHSKSSAIKEYYDAFLQRLTNVHFGAIAFDYDGTLCNVRDRFDPLSSSIANDLAALLRAGLVIGVATGRGASARQRLRDAIPKKYWSQVLVAYYNGSVIMPLQDNEPLASRTIHAVPEIEEISAEIQNDRWIEAHCKKIEPASAQLTLVPAKPQFQRIIYERAAHIARAKFGHSLNVWESSHTVDVVSASTSKAAILPKLAEMMVLGEEVLCVGDKGKLPGNDFELLGSPYSISVHEVSSDPDSCFNLAAPGLRGPAATHFYLQKCLAIGRRGSKFKTDHVR